MIDIQSATAEIRRGKEEEEKKKKIEETTGKIQCPHLLCRAAIKSRIIHAALDRT